MLSIRSLLLLEHFAIIIINTAQKYRNESRNTADHYGVLERFFVHCCWFWNQLKALLYTFHTLEWMKSCVKKDTSRNDRATVTPTAISYTNESKHARYQHNNKQPTHNFFAIQSFYLHTFNLKLCNYFSAFDISFAHFPWIKISALL